MLNKKTIRIFFIISLFFTCLTVCLIAGEIDLPEKTREIPANDDSREGAYLGGGLGIIVSLGMGYGLKRIYDVNREL